MGYVIVEYEFEPPLRNDEDRARWFNGLSPCLAVRDVQHLRSWVSEDGRRGVCEFKATDAQTVRDAYQSAKVRFARVWPATLSES